MKFINLGQTEYETTWQAMRAFTDERTDNTEDELWLCEHTPVYTLGQAGKTEHILNPANIPIVKSDRGGQVTYHGPGQLIVYTLFNLRRAGYGIREMVMRLENSVIAMLAQHNVDAHSRRDAPGVYVGEAKIAALGLRVRRGCSYHGIAINIDPDLTPFLGINPCGYEGMAVTSTQKLGLALDKEQLASNLCQLIQTNLEASSTVA